jgi:arsenite-transporting ATPase
VGKTTWAAALAIDSARHGTTLLVSTDPASSLADVLEMRVDATPRTVPGVTCLDAVNVDAAAAFDTWLAPRRPLLAAIALGGTYLDEDDVRKLLALALPGIDEIIGLLAATTIGADYDAVVIDSAPTGHTLRLLAAPALLERVAGFLDSLHAHHRELVSALRGRYKTDAADGLIGELARDGESLSVLLRDRKTTGLHWVTLPEPMALEETRDALASLERERLDVQTIVVNRVTPAPRQTCAWCEARRRFEARALAPMRRRFPNVELKTIPEFAREPRGVPALRTVARALSPWKDPGQLRPPVARRVAARLDDGASTAPSSVLPDTLRWVLFGGKGGVGKSTCAAAFALGRAQAAPARRILLLSSDPAHSLGDVFGVRIADRAAPIPRGPANLHVREIDPAAALDAFRARYVQAIDDVFGRLTRSVGSMGGDRLALAQLLDLAPPGVDEVIAISDVAEALTETGAPYDTIVSDTAPTGHALRLLQTPAVLHAWTKALMSLLLKYREVVPSGPLAALLVRLSRQLRAIGELLTDPVRTHFVLVTRAAALSREESVRLLTSLSSLGVTSTTVIVNALGAGTCARCRTRSAGERDEVARLRRDLPAGAPYAIIGTPAVMPPPHAVRGLSAWGHTWRRFQ